MKRPFGKNDVALLSERINQTLAAISVVNERVSKSFSNLIQVGKNQIQEERERYLQNLAEINDVDDSKAKILKDIARQRYEDVVVPIDIQNIAPSHSELITSVVNFHFAKKSEVVAQRISSLLPENPGQELSKLAPLTSELSWRLAARRDKLLAIETFARLQMVMESVERIGSPQALSQLSYINTQDSWNMFMSNPRNYLDYLDELFPGRFVPAELVNVSDVADLVDQFEHLMEEIDKVKNAPKHYYDIIVDEGRRVLQEEHGALSRVDATGNTRSTKSNSDEVNCLILPEYFTPSFSGLIVAVNQYCRAMKKNVLIKEVLDNLPSEPKKEVDKLKPLNSRESWNQTGRVDQIVAMNTFRRIKKLMEKDKLKEFVLTLTSGNQISESDAWEDFATSPDEYNAILDEIFPGKFIVKKLEKSEINRVVIEWKEMQETIETLRNCISYLYGEISESVQNALNDEHVALLKKIPVEKLLDEQTSINPASLRKEGYTDVYSVLCAENQNGRQFYRIGVNVFAALRRAKAISEEVWKDLRLRINLDNKTPAYTQIVSSVTRYRIAKQNDTKVQKLLKELPDNSGDLLRRVKPLRRTDYWKKTDRVGQIIAINAYEQIQSTIASILKVDNPFSLLEKLNIKESFAWRDFSLHPVEYFTILEEVCPERFSQSDDGYGLGKELSHQVDATQLQLDGMRCSLRGYQEWGVKYILNQKNVLLGDEMGLGKTIQALAAMVSLKNAGGKCFLVICPASVIENWCREISEKSILRAYNFHDNYFRNFEYWKNDGGVAVINYEQLYKLVKHLNSLEFDMVVVDEAHYIKNPEAARRINTLKICKNATRRLFMTGTPIENNVDEMIGLIGCLNQDVARAAQKYSFEYASEEFKRVISPVYYRRKREEVLGELPELVEIKEWCHMTTDDKVAYEDALLGESLMQARRVSWNHSHYDKASKIIRLKELVKEARNEKRRILIFSFFLDTLDTIKKIYGDTCIGVINGGTSLSKRQDILDEFDKSPAGSILAAQIEAGGVGLNIQAASVVIICEPQWKPSTETQAISRAYRMGQTRNVIVYRLLCLESIDERITELLARKQREFDTFADESIAASKDLALEKQKLEINSKEQKQLLASERERVLARKAARDKMVVHDTKEGEA